MASSPNISGIKEYLRFKPLAYLQRLSETIAASVTEEVTITGTSADGGSASGEIAFPRLDYLTVVMDVRREKGDYPLNSDGTIVSRQLGTRPDYSRTWAVT
jgi:hypothetical protein